MAKKSKFSIATKDSRIMELLSQADHKTSARWALDCVERVFFYYENSDCMDHHPKEALNVLKEWIKTGKFSMAVVRKAALDSHATARKIEMDHPEKSVARAAGQAVATAHVKTHAIGAANYSVQAVFRANENLNPEHSVRKERDWQYNHLLQLLAESKAS
ncbi:hypothetical protein EHQ23_07830 [Leptospira bourretii]|uniref:Imm-5-like domain-containing protein n=2 Tax=Leptospira bourretii TaxID=2484962 RepID=A0A4V3JLE3_9LEPT|nr:hypothetical protein [Leptospira bourretii]TGK86305.1 hypothetical protein EHQ23_07830 [Leptospira bourretii]TGK92336.1 hypothetical protein EHQ26_09200 [Leptospira bourretii]TGL26555.1 hypothetical protein EHQ45_19520 [Leptospira bourretii]